MQKAELGMCLVVWGVWQGSSGARVHSHRTRLWWGTLESLSSSITSWFLLMETCRQNTNAFQEIGSGFCCVFFPTLALCKVSYGSPSEVLVTHLTFSDISPRLMCSGRLTWTPLFQKMKSMSLKILVRLKEKLCEFCIITKKEKVGHIWSLFCWWKKKEDEEEVSDDLVFLQLLKTKRWCQRPQGLTPRPHAWVSPRMDESMSKLGSVRCVSRRAWLEPTGVSLVCASERFIGSCHLNGKTVFRGLVWGWGIHPEWYQSQATQEALAISSSLTAVVRQWG